MTTRAIRLLTPELLELELVEDVPELEAPELDDAPELELLLLVLDEVPELEELEVPLELDSLVPLELLVLAGAVDDPPPPPQPLSTSAALTTIQI